MEIQTSMTTCPNGHPYDSARYASCPICGSSVSGGFSPTEPIGGASGSFSPTEPIGGGFTPGGAAPGGFTPTEPIMGGNFNAPGTFPDSPDPFGDPTLPGGALRREGDFTEPVVGWLVCIEGPMRGVDYRVHAGYNYIGRDSGDIRIQGDKQISRQRHAMIAFDSTELTYFVGPAAGHNLIKVNGKTVLNAVEITNYDVISIGSTKLIFVALCSEKFAWDAKESDHV